MMLVRLDTEVGVASGVGIVAAVVSLLATSRDGLSEQDLLLLLVRRMSASKGKQEHSDDHTQSDWKAVAMQSDDVAETPEGADTLDEFVAVARHSTRFGALMHGELWMRAIELICNCVCSHFESHRDPFWYADILLHCNERGSQAPVTAPSTQWDTY